MLDFEQIEEEGLEMSNKFICPHCKEETGVWIEFKTSGYGVTIFNADGTEDEESSYHEWDYDTEYGSFPILAYCNYCKKEVTDEWDKFYIKE